MAGWAGFLAVAAGVMATLTGLSFVAVSINLARILEFPGLPERAAETTVQLLSALIVSLIALVPGQSRLVLGVQLGLAGPIRWILQDPQHHSKTMTSAQSFRSCSRNSLQRHSFLPE
jgi:hypothetical protein